MMPQVTFAPERLRHSKQQAQKHGENYVQNASAKERPMDEIMGDGVRVPPEPERDDRKIGEIQNERDVDPGQQNEKGIPV